MKSATQHSLTRRLAILAFMIGVPLFGITIPVAEMWTGEAEWNSWPLFWFGIWLVAPLGAWWLLKQGSGKAR